ncbi:hypothetical protein SPRG_09401 [Saprolegnia parasitica CBS 223.65]|uniref:Hyaluronan-mediated motility receptor C-terminal domain-containing protein n=1 Tax=Saprolegnia parasitica (strain CBS 223.65) TaxID=695850 RepID=A0A067C4K0_SAPPC|nr:hypothetical protein SPRG_09401 [Saprolegnia parasitica CBS 223.65]KDO25458.1 hypothetical protein SPRG_09401 [Saprolegnia parasitica CBS 223.65]|eukprot:XP_012203884.1 hypothetical protein SPRG_09401 [Saprolegnia parasitica CBS 223.65]
MAPPPPTDVSVLCLRLHMRKMQTRVAGLLDALAKATPPLEPQSSPAKGDDLRPGETDKMIADLVVEVERLKHELSSRDDENARLQNDASALHRHNVRLQEENAALRLRLEHDEVDAELSPSKTDDMDDDRSCSSNERPVYDDVDVDRLAVELDIHTQNLRDELRLMALERDRLETERDEAQAAAARALAEGSRLAGHANGQQRIKYVQSLRDENNRLTLQLRDAESRLARLKTAPTLTKHVDATKPRTTISSTGSKPQLPAKTTTSAKSTLPSQSGDP